MAVAKIILKKCVHVVRSNVAATILIDVEAVLKKLFESESEVNSSGTD